MRALTNAYNFVRPNPTIEQTSPPERSHLVCVSIIPPCVVGWLVLGSPSCVLGLVGIMEKVGNCFN
ncbi:hypothetical protein ACVND7_12335 [Avibacterium paragallinarum]